MKEYLTVLLAVCSTAAVVKVLSPDNATKKYIEIICALCVICAVCQPIFGAINGVGGIMSHFDYDKDINENYDEIYKKYLDEQGIEMAQESISNALCDSVGADDGAIRIRIYIDEENGGVSSATALVGLSAVDVPPDDIRSFVRERLGVECEIVYKFFDE